MNQRSFYLNSDSNLHSSQLDCAIAFSNRGWPIFPLHFPKSAGLCSCGNSSCTGAGKHPMTARGFKDASTDKNIIENWWRKNPQANLGIVTGQQSGLVVLDIDPRHGGTDSLIQLQQTFENLPKTLRVKTGGDGWHYYFSCPSEEIKNRVDILPGIDFRGDGGYIVAPPSIHASMKPYAWDGGIDFIAPLPSWLLELVQNKKKEPQQVVNGQNFEEGTRNNSLVSIGGFLKSKGLDTDQLFKALSAFNENLCNPPLAIEEIKSISHGLKKYQEKPWPEIRELPDVAKAPAMTTEMIPEGLNTWCHDISERMQVPIEYIAGPAIVMLATLIGRKASIRPKKEDDWQVVPNLWGMLIAPPGSLKSPALASVLKPFYKLTLKAQEKYLEEEKLLKENEIIAKTEIEALKDSLKSAIKQGKAGTIDEKKQQLAIAIREYEKKKCLKEKRYLTNDPTIEKLLMIMKDNPQGVLLFRDEISGWLETMHKSGREGDREFFLESWNGDSPYTMDRIGRGSTFVDAICLSVLGGLQPGKFETYVSSVAKGGRSDDGLLQRFQILLFPERRKSWKKVDRKPDPVVYQKIEELVAAIDEISDPVREEGILQRLSLNFSDEAQELADTWREKLENRFCSGKLHSILESHLSKFRSLMPSLALIFSIVDSFHRHQKAPTEVDMASTQLAITWCAFLEKHACKAYGEYLDPDLDAARHLVAKIKEGKVKDYDRCRDIYRRGWKGVNSANLFDGALKVLQDHGFARTETISPNSGGKSEIIRLNPSLRLV